MPVLAHCNGICYYKLLVVTASVYHDDVYPSATVSANRRLKIPGEFLDVGMGGMVCFQFYDCPYVYTSLVGTRLQFFLPSTATSLPLSWPRLNH